jgi:acyl-CoA synthetase (AMP-forming)/AMP-acid ligase II
VPRRVVLVEALPLNAGGKVLKTELRRRQADGIDHVVTNERSS